MGLEKSRALTRELVNIYKGLVQRLGLKWRSLISIFLSVFRAIHCLHPCVLLPVSYQSSEFLKDTMIWLKGENLVAGKLPFT